jgi:hypothetical protein
VFLIAQYLSWVRWTLSRQGKDLLQF